MTSTSASPTTPMERPRWKAVALPSEHGGWGLTLEPVLLGLLIAPSVAGLALGIAAFGAFLVRTPLKLALVDVRRERWLARSALALRITVAELALMGALAAVAVARAGWSWVIPVALAAPFVVVQLMFDVRSRGRRLVPELCGAVGMASVVAVMVVAAAKPTTLAAAAWLVLASRSIGAIPFVRVQITRLRGGEADVRASDLAQLVAVVCGIVAVAVRHSVLLGAIGLLGAGVLQMIWVRRPPTAARVLGVRQMALGFGLVAITAVGIAVT